MAVEVSACHQRILDVNHILTKKPDEEYDHKLSKIIWRFYEKYSQNYKMLNKKINIRNDLSNILFKYFNDCGNGFKFVDIFISGSTLNGFATLDSDLDLCFVVTDNYDFEFCKPKKMKVLSQIEEILDLNEYKLKDCQLIEARVPILRYIHSETEIQVEINVNNEFGIRNTRLLYCYSKLDWRVAPICIIIKRWAKYYSIIDSFNGALSSYTIELMVIFYLQNCIPALLPCLQETNPELFDSNTEISSYRELPDVQPLVDTFHSLNDLSLAQLFVGFFNFYLNVFDFTKHVASVRTSKALSKQKYRPFLSDPNQWEYICVEEPFSRSNSGRTVYEESCYQKIVNGFQKMDNDCKEIMKIHCICED